MQEIILYYLLFVIFSAQREGGLSDATSPYTDKNDPFYGHCKLHVDKLVAKLVYSLGVINQ